MRPSSFVTDGEHYDACHAYRVDDLALWTSLVTPGMRVLELGCGTGRVAIPMARAGAIVTGVDASPSMLDRARAKSGDVEWVLADIRTFALGRADYALAVLAFNTINVLVERADTIACLARAREHLAPGGRIVVDAAVPLVAKLASSTTDEHVASYRVGEVAVKVTGRRTFDMARQLRRLELTIQASDRVEPEHDVLETHVAFPWEVALLVERAGFHVAAVYGDYARGPLVATSSQCIVVGER